VAWADLAGQAVLARAVLWETLVFRERPDRVVSLAYPACQGPLGHQASRATEETRVILVDQVWAIQVRPACRVSRVILAHLDRASLVFRACVARPENKVNVALVAVLVLLAHRVIASFATLWLCKPIGAPPRRALEQIASKRFVNYISDYITHTQHFDPWPA